MQETKLLLKAERYKKKLGKQDFHYEKGGFEPIPENQKENQIEQQQFCEKRIQALHDVSQTSFKAIKYQTETIQESSTALNKKLQKSNKRN